MKRAMAVSCAAILVVSLAACGGGGDAMVEAQEGFADKTCACQSFDCVKAVQEEQNAWVAKHGGAAMGDEDTYSKIEAANKRLSECIQRIVAARQ